MIFPSFTEQNLEDLEEFPVDSKDYRINKTTQLKKTLVCQLQNSHRDNNFNIASIQAK